MMSYNLEENSPKCHYHACNSHVILGANGEWNKFCSRACLNKNKAWIKSEFSRIEQPKCNNKDCYNLVDKGRNGRWKIYCSRKCAGKCNSALSRDKARLSCLTKYGVDNPFKSPIIKEQIKESILSKYGKEWSRHLSNLPEDNIKKLFDRAWLEEQNKSKSLKEISSEIGISPAALGVRFRNLGLIPNIQNGYSISFFEKEIIKFLEEYDISIEKNNRSILFPKEIDIFLPEFNLAIECNGVYWHSELHGKDCNYHINKIKRCLDKNIELIHVTDYEWENKKEIIKSILLYRINKSKKIFSRKCRIDLVSKIDERAFLEKNHIQGFIGSNVCYGLYYENKLVSVMSFGKSRYEKNKIELLRFSTILNHVVIGGASKLFKHFIKEHNPISIISYSHKDKFNGNLYKILGFEYSHSTKPSYYYTKDYINFYNRIKYQKHKLPKLLENFDPNLTEWENMQNNGYDRIWDCGNDVWKWKYNK